MPARPVITNNTPLVALWAVGQLDLLHQLFGEIWTPKAVCDEFRAADPARREATLRDAGWIRCVQVQDAQQVSVYVGLDQGEAEVLALAQECDPRLVIIDELRGRRYAQRLGLPLTGTLGVLLLAKEQKLIPTVRPVLTALLDAGLYLSPGLMARTLSLAHED